MSRARAGFTLIELLVVLVIISVGTALAAPALRHPDGADAEDTAQAIVALRDRTRAVAVARAAETELWLEPATGAWVVIVVTGRNADTVRAGRLAASPEAQISGGRGGWARATFDALGGARAHVVIVHDGRAEYAVTTDPWTGISAVRAH